MSPDEALQKHADRKRAVAASWVRLQEYPEWQQVAEFLTALRTLDIRSLGPTKTDLERAFLAGRLHALEALLSRPADAVRELARNPLLPPAPGDPYEPPPNTNVPMGRTG